MRSGRAAKPAKMSHFSGERHVLLFNRLPSLVGLYIPSNRIGAESYVRTSVLLFLSCPHRPGNTALVAAHFIKQTRAPTARGLPQQ